MACNGLRLMWFCPLHPPFDISRLAHPGLPSACRGDRLVIGNRVSQDIPRHPKTLWPTIIFPILVHQNFEAPFRELHYAMSCRIDNPMSVCRMNLAKGRLGNMESALKWSDYERLIFSERTSKALHRDHPALNMEVESWTPVLNNGRPPSPELELGVGGNSFCTCFFFLAGGRGK